MKVYVAGSSEQLERVTAAMNALEERGHTVTHDWCTEVRAVGSANPPAASLYSKLRWAREDLNGVLEADILWLLLPTEISFGACFEFGFAVAKNIPVIISGGSSDSIFTAFAIHSFDRDDIALDTVFPYISEEQ